MSILSSLRRLKRNIGVYLRLQQKDIELVIVYTMGKVGSTSLRKSLQAYDVQPLFSLHRLNLENINRVKREYRSRGLVPREEDIGKLLNRYYLEKQKPAKFITVVRDPISRNVSAFFENFGRFTGKPFDIETDYSLAGLTNIFLEQYNHDIPLTWFDTEVRQVLGIDIYNHPFPATRGFLEVTQGAYQLLVLKLETDDRMKETAIRDFLDLPDFQLLRANVGKDKEYGATYKKFTRNIRLPDVYIKRMYTSKYAQHFYTPEEIEAMRLRWGRMTTSTLLSP